MTTDSSRPGEPHSSNPWWGRLVHWKDRSTWLDVLSQWMLPHFRNGAFARLARLKEKDICWDDSDWLDVVLAPRLSIDVEDAVDLLANDLEAAVLRAYHGCRVADAGVYTREGLRRNDPARLEAEVRKIVAEEESLAWRRSTLDQDLAGWSARERDTGWLFVCVDDQPQVDRIGHYMLYGSEWISAFLGFSGHRVLRRRGVPTMIVLDVPFNLTTPETRRSFANKLLQEWVRVVVNSPTFIPKLDFTVFLPVDLPAPMVVGHYHPTSLKDPLSGYDVFETETPHCPSCATT